MGWRLSYMDTLHIYIDQLYVRSAWSNFIWIFCGLECFCYHKLIYQKTNQHSLKTKKPNNFCLQAWEGQTILSLDNNDLVIAPCSYLQTSRCWKLLERQRNHVLNHSSHTLDCLLFLTRFWFLFLNYLWGLQAFPICTSASTYWLRKERVLYTIWCWGAKVILRVI